MISEHGAVYAANTLLLAVSGTWEQFVILSNVSALLLYVGCAIAAWRLRRRDVRTDAGPFRVPGGPLVPVLACSAIGWVLVATITAREFAAVGVTLLIATAIYRRAIAIDRFSFFTMRRSASR